MAAWCMDRGASAWAGLPVFRRPFPQDDYLRDRRWNKFLMDAMSHCTRAVRVFQKPAQDWKKEEQAFYDEMLEGLQAHGYQI